MSLPYLESCLESNLGAPRASYSAPVVAPSHTTRSGDASFASSSNTEFLKMFRGIFAMCCRTYQRMDVMEQHLQIVRCN
jgi:hypothetical protein